MGMAGTTSQPAAMGTSMKGATASPQTMKGTQMNGQPQAGGIVQGNPGLMQGLFTGAGQAQGYNGTGQGYQGNQGMMAPGSSFANPANPALGGGFNSVRPISNSPLGGGNVSFQTPGQSQ